MSVALLAPRDMVAKKPPHGEACTHCGLCCAMSLCDLAQAVFARPFTPGPCPALLFDGEKSLCGVALNPRAFHLSAPQGDAELTAAALLLIGTGYGCDSRINGEPVNTAFNAELDRRDRVIAREVAKAKTIWNVP